MLETRTLQFPSPKNDAYLKLVSTKHDGPSSPSSSQSIHRAPSRNQVLRIALASAHCHDWLASRRGHRAAASSKTRQNGSLSCPTCNSMYSPHPVTPHPRDHADSLRAPKRCTRKKVSEACVLRTNYPVAASPTRTTRHEGP